MKRALLDGYNRDDDGTRETKTKSYVVHWLDNGNAFRQVFLHNYLR